MTWNNVSCVWSEARPIRETFVRDICDAVAALLFIERKTVGTELIANAHITPNYNAYISLLRSRIPNT